MFPHRNLEFCLIGLAAMDALLHSILFEPFLFGNILGFCDNRTVVILVAASCTSAARDLKSLRHEVTGDWFALQEHLYDVHHEEWVRECLFRFLDVMDSEAPHNPGALCSDT